jgi:signal transduction histidine kinase
VVRVLREGVVVSLAYLTVLIAKDGTKRSIVDSTAQIQDDEGNITGVVFVFRDDCKHRQMTERLRYPLGDLGKIFELLFTPQARGIGLGLAVSRNLVKVNGGKSEVQQYSIFTVALPLDGGLILSAS